MERCPICRARVKDDDNCYRCGSDLSWPLKIETQARVWEQQAVQALINDDLLTARRTAEQALQSQRTPFALTLLHWISECEAQQAEQDFDEEKMWLGILAVS